ARLVAQDLRQVVAGLDGVQGIFVDGPLEQRLGARGVALLPGDETDVGDGRAVFQPVPDARGLVLAPALRQHRALVEARFQQARIVIGRALERVRDGAALRAGEAAGFLGGLVPLHGLGELGALILGDLALLLLLRDDLRGAGLRLAAADELGPRFVTHL